MQKLYLSFVGGGTVKETINQFVKETFHEELMVHFTWVREETHTMYNSKLAQIYFGNVICTILFKLHILFLLAKYVKKITRYCIKICIKIL